MLDILSGLCVLTGLRVDNEELIECIKGDQVSYVSTSKDFKVA